MEGKIDRLFLICIILLVLIGLIMVFSSSGVISGNPFKFFIKQLFFNVFGFIILFYIVSKKKPFYSNVIFIHVLLFLSFILLILALFSKPINGTRRWIEFFGFTFQPSELAKLSIILFLSYYFSLKRVEKISFYAVPAVIVIVFSFLIISEPDFGSGVLILAIAAGMFYFSGIKIRYLGIGLAAILPFLVFSAVSSEYRLDRILSFLFPFTDIRGRDFQIYQSLLAVGSGGFTGVGLGKSVQKLFYLPQAQTDFIFAVIGEELGFVGCISVLSLIFIVLWRIFLISKKSREFFFMLLSAGIGIHVALQAFLNISMVLKLLPTKGLPLPFVGYGGSSLLVLLIESGIVLSTSKRRY
ncbi:MAG: putative lipid II flippase FtsW [Acidobacteriota bacterium]